MLYPPFIFGFGESKSPNFQLDLLQNMYLENAVTDASESRKALVGAPGSVLFHDLGDGPIRGQLSIEGYEYIVAGSNLWEKDPLDNFTLLGDVGNDGEPVRMVANNPALFLCSARQGYVWNGVFAPVPSPPWTALIDVAFLDGYFIGLDDDGGPVGGQFFISSPNDPTTWDPLDFATVPSTADKLRALATSHHLLFVFGTTIIQPFYDSGNADFPLLPDQSGTIQQGTAARDTVCALAVGPDSNDNSIYFLSENTNGHAELTRLDGYALVKVSTPPLETLWQELVQGDVAGAVCWTFQENGHAFVQINFPQSSLFPGGSWRYDSTTDRWAEVTWTNPRTGLQESHRGINHAFNLVRHIIGDREHGILWKMNTHLFTDSDPLNTSAKVPNVSVRQCLLPNAANSGSRMFIPRLQLLCETGVGDGTGSGPGNDPQIGLEMSFDGGHNFGSVRYASAGQQGNYDARVFWTRCGSGYQPALRISMDAPVRRWWFGLDMTIKEGVS